jgi:hypothetical protein
LLSDGKSIDVNLSQAVNAFAIQHHSPRRNQLVLVDLLLLANGHVKCTSRHERCRHQPKKKNSPECKNVFSVPFH